MEPLPGAARMPPGPPRPPAPPTTDEFPQPSWGWWSSPPVRRPSWLTVLRESWYQLRLSTWPARGTVARIATLIVATVVLAMLVVFVADGGLAAGVELLSGR